MRIAITFLILAASTTEALACSCLRMTREDVIANADLVVKGTIEESDANPKDTNAMKVTARVRITERIKGEAPEMITVTSAGNSAACGIGLPQGATVELALHRRESGEYSASLCSQLGLHDGKNPNLK